MNAIRLRCRDMWPTAAAAISLLVCLVLTDALLTHAVPAIGPALAGSAVVGAAAFGGEQLLRSAGQLPARSTVGMSWPQRENQVARCELLPVPADLRLLRVHVLRAVTRQLYLDRCRRQARMLTVAGLLLAADQVLILSAGWRIACAAADALLLLALAACHIRSPLGRYLLARSTSRILQRHGCARVPA
jgi:hypothetical protein